MKPIFQTLGCAVLAFTFSACVVGPDYAPPEIVAPDQFVSQDVLRGVARPALDAISDEGENAINWWRGFADPVLDQLVEEALMDNYAIAIAEARLKDAEAQARRVASRDELRASTSLDAGVDQRNEFGGSDGSSTSGGMGGSFSLALPLDVFGQNKREVEAAIATIEGASANLRGAVLRVSSDVASEYLRMRGNQRQLTLLRESVALQEKTLAIVKSRFVAGLAPELDLRRAESAVASLQADIPPLQESLTNSRNSIATLSGKFPGALNALLLEERDIPTFQGTIQNALPIDVLSMRPDVLEAESGLKRAIAEIGVAKAEWYPALQIGKQLSLSGIGASGEPTTGIFFASLSALIQQVVFDGGARQANLDSAKARAQEALARYRQTLLFAIEDVEASLSALQSSIDRQASLALAVDASSRSAFQAEILYRQGLASFLDVVDAQRVLASAQQKLAAARTAYAFQIANLFRVLGATINQPSHASLPPE